MMTLPTSLTARAREPPNDLEFRRRTPRERSDQGDRPLQFLVRQLIEEAICRS